MAIKIKIGSKVVVNECSGLESGRVGYVLEPRFYLHMIKDKYSRMLVTERKWKVVAILAKGEEWKDSECEYYTALPVARLLKVG